MKLEHGKSAGVHGMESCSTRSAGPGTSPARLFNACSGLAALTALPLQ